MKKVLCLVVVLFVLSCCCGCRNNDVVVPVEPFISVSSDVSGTLSEDVLTDCYYGKYSHQVFLKKSHFEWRDYGQGLQAVEVADSYDGIIRGDYYLFYNLEEEKCEWVHKDNLPTYEDLYSRGWSGEVRYQFH